MSKKKILVTYPEMLVGGSTTSLLAFLNCIDKEKYDVDLQLYKNKGPLLTDIPEGINLLPEAFMYASRFGSFVKKVKCVLTGSLFKARLAHKKIGKKGYSGQVMADFQAKHLSRKAKTEYDYAIGFLEGWADRYIAYKVKTGKKLCWLHSTFANLAKVPELERPWMKLVDNIVFVADNCRDDFKIAMPDMADKAITVRNITDSAIVRARAEKWDADDEELVRFKNATGFKIITVCRATVSVKGLDRIITCAKQLKENQTDFIWTIVGGGEDLEQFKEMICKAELSDCVFAIDNRMNPLPFVKIADVFCLLSRYEGKPMVITESMILGTPPFVTRYLSADEQIQNGVDGVVVDNADDTMFEALKYYAENPTELEKFRETLLSREYGNAEYMREIEQEYLA